ncbi:MAG: hypothetical protein F4139_04830 [Gemmatimonadetes bacterium]|nr:hypothetical protein [Gemmatimonadota bacterium]MYB98918.1 hypothetical protein [Gemmatimonadota bacterium]MYH52260.1 hypothetical protein [Gemmatimonadota bacterium]MYI46416.1 hypothetical protein [Gemmatimonadota bacterium]MYK65968.1 hypothetical protein [Gemmatimonadota bacterium]
MLDAPRCGASSGRLACGVGLVLALLASASLMEAQEEIVIPDDPAPPCVIEFTPSGPELGRRTAGVLDDTWPSQVAEIELLDEGRIAMAEPISDRFFVAYRDGSGGRWVGRGGEGPGEYSFAKWVRPAGERLHVFDPILMRRTVLDATTLEVVRTNPLPIHFHADALVLNDSSYVINGSIFTRDHVGYVLHLFNGEGEVVRSFDEIPFVMPGEAPIRGGFRWLAPARDGGVWSAWQSEYRVDLWDATSATLRRSLVRDAPWFPAHNGWGQDWHPDRPDDPVIADIMEDSEQRLWVFILVASDRWPECWVKEPPSANPMAPEYTPRAGCPRFEERIEVLDPEAGHVLAAQTLPLDFALHRLTAGEVFALEQDDLGIVRVRQWRPTLRPLNDSQGERKC